MVIETERLLLRPWEESDAPRLYELAHDPEIGRRAGWAPHACVEESRAVIRDALGAPETYAICLRADGASAERAETVIGAVGLTGFGVSDLATAPGEYELGYWCGRRYWGHGYVPEAARALIERARHALGARTIWCSAFADNPQSLRVQEKCGFTVRRVDWASGGTSPYEGRDLVVSRLDVAGSNVVDQAIDLLGRQPEADRYLCMTEPLRLGHSSVRFYNPDLGVLTQVARDGVYYAAPFSEKGARAMHACMPAGAVVNVNDIALAPLIAPAGEPEPYEFWVYRGAGDADPGNASVEIRPLTVADADVVQAHYKMLSRAGVIHHLEHGWIQGAYHADELVGFIGEHDEGAMGMLEVFPEARRHGVARALEATRVNELRAAGRAPYCHVVPENAASLALQARLGMERVGPMQCWVKI